MRLEFEMPLRWLPYSALRALAPSNESDVARQIVRKSVFLCAKSGFGNQLSALQNLGMKKCFSGGVLVAIGG